MFLLYYYFADIPDTQLVDRIVREEFIIKLKKCFIQKLNI